MAEWLSRNIITIVWRLKRMVRMHILQPGMFQTEPVLDCINRCYMWSRYRHGNFV